jgi:hypothetical protein
MAAPGGKFYIQDVIKDVAPHHESFAKLWETKWKKPVCSPCFTSIVAFCNAEIMPPI